MTSGKTSRQGIKGQPEGKTAVGNVEAENMKKTFVYFIAGLLIVGWCVNIVHGAERRLTYSAEAQVMLNPSGAMVTVQKPRLKFFDTDGKLIKSRKLRGNEIVSLPDGGNVVGITRYHDNSPTTLKPVAFTLFDLAGRQLYSIKNPAFSSVIVSGTGEAIVGIAGAEGLPESSLRFYDEQGKEVDSMTIEYFQGGRFSADGTVFVFSTAKDGIFAYSSTGQLLAGYGPGAVYDLSADGDVFVTWHNGTLRVYSGGNRVATFPTAEIVRAVTVSENGKYFGWASPQKVAVYATGTDSAWCEVTPVAANENFRSLAIGEDGNHFAAGIDIDAGREVPAEKRHTQGRVTVYDRQGQVFTEKNLTYENWNAKMPAVSFLEGGKVLSVITRAGTYFLQLPLQAIK